MKSFLFSFVWTVPDPVNFEDLGVESYVQIVATDEAQALNWGEKIAEEFFRDHQDAGWGDVGANGKIFDEIPSNVVDAEILIVSVGDFPNFEMWERQKKETIEAFMEARRKSTVADRRRIYCLCIICLIAGTILAIYRR